MAATVLPANKKELLEFVARELDAAEGKVRIEILCLDGEVTEAHVHDRLTPGELERDPVDWPALIPPE